LKKRASEKLPDFLILGAGKSGTTSLDNYLSEHPQIFMSPVKEPNFFAYLNHKADDFDIQESRQHFLESVTTFDAYFDLFTAAKENQLLGETSNTYLYGQRSLESIKEHLPNAKLIVIFRQPAERLYSRYLHLARENQLPTPDFESCLDNTSIWWKRPDLINEGFYYKHLSRFYAAFPADQIKVFLFEDLKNPEQLFTSLFDFLGVDRSFRPATDVVYNQSGFVKNQFKNRLVGPNGLVIKSAKALLPFFVKWAKKTPYFEKKLNNIRAANLSKPKLSTEMKKRLTNEVYKEDIQQLEKLIQRDLSHWYQF
jgi:hypothetical protein